MALVVFVEKFANGFDARLDDPQSLGKSLLRQKRRGHRPGVHHLHVRTPLVELQFHLVVARMGADKSEQPQIPLRVAGA